MYLPTRPCISSTPTGEQIWLYNNNNNNKLQLGYHPVAVVILHVHKYEKILDIKLILMFAIVKLIF